jgi:putative hydrolase of the HAD superfamily
MTRKRLPGERAPQVGFKTLIFDLSEVLIAGLVGIEEPLSELLEVSEETVLPAFGGDLLEAICRGRLTEEVYLAQVLARQGWDVPAPVVEQIIRQNLARPVPGMHAFVSRLSGTYELVLLSDHVAEWVVHIRSIHPMLGLFDRQFFSYELGRTKREPDIFRHVLGAVGREPEECLFVDDSEHNVRTARSVGITSIHFSSAGQLAQDLAELGVGGSEV